MHALETDDRESVPDSCVYIVDGNAMLHSMVNLPLTFGLLALTLLSYLPKSATVHFVTDPYHKDSIKESERQRCGSAPAFLIGGPSTRLPRNFAAFLQNSNNKQQLLKFILKEWQQSRYASRLSDRRIYFVCDESCVCLHSADGISVTATEIPELISTQEEADTRIILHCLYAAERQETEAIVVKSPDTDVFILLVYYVQTIGVDIIFDTGSGDRRRRMSMKKVLSAVGNDLAEALPGLHAFTGCDSTSAFVRQGKKLPLKLLKRSPQFVDAFRCLGQVANAIPENIFSQLESFVCAMYSSKITDVNSLRYFLFESRYTTTLPSGKLTAETSAIDLSLIPPCRESLRKHAMRANYQTAVWRTAHSTKPCLPSPAGCGWKIGDAQLEIEWTADNIMPAKLVDILTNRNADDDDTHDEVEEDDIVDNIIDDVFYDEDDDMDEFCD